MIRGTPDFSSGRVERCERQTTNGWPLRYRAGTGRGRFGRRLGGGGPEIGHGASRADGEGPAGGGQDLHPDRRTRRVPGLLLRRPERTGDRLRHPVHAHPEVHRGLHARALAGLRLRRRVQGGAGPGPHRRQGHPLRRHPPPGTLGDRGGLRRSLSLHQRQGQPAPGGDRPAGLRDQADRRQSLVQVRARRGLRHPQHRVRDGGDPVRGTPHRRRLCPHRGVQRQVPGRPDLLELRQGEGAHRPREVLRTSSCRPTARTSPTPARVRATAGASPTRSAPSATSAASSAGARPSRPAARPRTRTSCM